jgi:hypothetical protein
MDHYDKITALPAGTRYPVIQGLQQVDPTIDKRMGFSTD